MEKNKLNQFKTQLLKNLSLGYTLARTGHFSTQGRLLPLIDRIATGEKRDPPEQLAAHLQQALKKILVLHKKDSQNIADGFYPIDVLYPENPFKHAFRYPSILLDAYRASKRRKEKISNDFLPESEQFLNELPEYYKRNFHFQTGGYLTDISAELYEHQVEILFSGAADAMRRLLIPQLKVHFQGSDGEGLNFLEVASGTGRFTKFLALAFPKATITCVDLSFNYLAKAKTNLSDFKRINFLQGAAEKLPFQKSSYDAVVSCFMFHELPEHIRNEVVKAGMDVLKAGGLYGLVDSLQKNDDADFEWALKQFPMDFHEPFYKNYVDHPLEALLEDSGLKNVQSEVGFLSKAISGVKS
ncbi:MAG: methyltransferase domain-containing protein [Bdellovibrio sp.]|nr:methyltransferase domain-containing protein [Bdellovibrio sp.]